MNPIASHITAFLCDRLPLQRGASPHTCKAYADTFRILLTYASSRYEASPSSLYLEQLDAPLVADFLDSLERDRANSSTTRNSRLAAIKSFMRFLEHRVPSMLEQIRRILAIPSKRGDSKLTNYLTVPEIQAILNAPDMTTHSGVRDRAMIQLCYAAGLRVSELVTLPLSALVLHPTPSVKILGKGRSERCLPLWKQTAGDLRAWLGVRGEVRGVAEIFLNKRGTPITRYGFEYILNKHVRKAQSDCPSLIEKSVSPHVLRHTCAMIILQSTGDIRKVSLWLGHSDIQTTQRYLHADPITKMETLNATMPPVLRPGSFQPPDKLIASLKGH